MPQAIRPGPSPDPNPNPNPHPHPNPIPNTPAQTPTLTLAPTPQGPVAAVYFRSYISPYLPMSPHISPYLAGPRGRRLLPQLHIGGLVLAGRAEHALSRPGDAGRCGEIRGRYGEMWGDMGGYGEPSLGQAPPDPHPGRRPSPWPPALTLATHPLTFCLARTAIPPAVAPPPPRPLPRRSACSP